MFKHLQFKEDILPHLLVVVGFLLFTAIYFKPAVLGDEHLQQGDIMQHRGASRELKKFNENTGEKTLWVNNMFGGMPTYLISSQAEGSLGKWFRKALTQLISWPYMTIFLGLCLYYVLLLVVGVTTPFAALGAFLFAFAPFSMISLEAGHNTKVATMGSIPLVMAGVLLYFVRRRVWLALAVTGLGMCIAMANKHYQIIYYGGLITVAFGISEFIFAYKRGQLSWWAKGVGFLLLVVALGTATNINRLMALNKYLPHSTRGVSELKKQQEEKKGGGLDLDYIFGWSMGIDESLTLLIPNYYGGSSSGELEEGSETYRTLVKNRVNPQQLSRVPYYWGKQPFTGGPTYAGAISLFLFVLGLSLTTARWRWWLLGITVFGLVLMWGKNFMVFNEAMVKYFPAYSRFRTVTMAYYFIQFALPLSGMIGLYWIYRHGKEAEEQTLKKIYYAAGALGGICLIFVVMPGIAGDFVGNNDGRLPEWLKPALKADRKAMLREDAFRSLSFILLAAGALWLYIKKNVNFWMAFGIIAAVSVIDLWAVNKRYLNENNFTPRSNEELLQPDPSDQQIMQDQGYYRVLNANNPFNDAKTSYFHNSIGGYSAAKLGIYQNLIEHRLSKELSSLVQAIQSKKFNPQQMSSFPVLNMLNTKYIKLGPKQGNAFQNPAALGHAWFVEQVEPLPNSDSVLTAMADFNPKRTAFVNQERKVPGTLNYQVSDKANIELSQYQPNEMKYKTSNPKAGFAVFSEIHYPDDWTITIDGEEVEMYRVNHVLRGLEVPAGAHEIVFRYDPQFYKTSKIAGYLASFLLIGLTVFGFKRGLQHPEKTAEDTEIEG